MCTTLQLIISYKLSSTFPFPTQPQVGVQSQPVREDYCFLQQVMTALP
jgi:hypothetical protein